MFQSATDQTLMRATLRSRYVPVVPLVMLVAANHLLTSPLKNDGVKVSWDDDIPFPIFFWETKKIQPCSSHHQPCSIANGWWFRNGIWASRWGPRFRGNYHRSMAFLWPLNSEIFIIFLKKH